MAKSKGIDPKKAVKAIQAIHDILYLDIDPKGDFYNGSKTWDANTLDFIAKAVATAIARPSEDHERCDECGSFIPVVAGGGLANKRHLESCSLYDAEQE